MRIRLLVDIQGFGVRGDGTNFEWPGRGGEIDIEDSVAKDMIHAHQAVPVTTFEAPVETTTVDEADAEVRTDVASAAELTARPPATAEEEPAAEPEREREPDSAPPADPPAEAASEAETAETPAERERRRGRGVRGRTR